VFIPYLGAFTGLLLATVAALLQFSTWHGLVMVWVVFGIGQFLESFIVTPKIVGDRIGLSPFWVIFSLMAFGQLMGFVGMLAGLPLAAVTLVLLREGANAYFHSRFYKHK
jgi:acetyltransferase, GNAT family